jgi:hypothetical protein
MKHHRKLVEDANKTKRPETRPHNDVPVKDAATAVMLDHLHAVQSSTLQQLDILRKTRGQREVGSVKIPAHLQVAMPMDVSDVEVRSSLAPVLGPKG